MCFVSEAVTYCDLVFHGAETPFHLNSAEIPGGCVRLQELRANVVLIFGISRLNGRCL